MLTPLVARDLTEPGGFWPYAVELCSDQLVHRSHISPLIARRSTNPKVIAAASNGCRSSAQLKTAVHIDKFASA
jgi:hypothetical protein